MPASHLLAALAVVVIWGVNFVVIKVGLREVPPLLLAALRFALAAFPAVFLVARPSVPFARIAVYGLVMFSAQFGLLFGGMYLGMPAGLASLALQVHVFFTIALPLVRPTCTPSRRSGVQCAPKLIPDPLAKEFDQSPRSNGCAPGRASRTETKEGGWRRP